MSVISMASVPSPRARTAEQLAQAVTGGHVPTERLCGLVGDLRNALGVEHAQVSIISDRQIAVVVDGRLARIGAVEDPNAPVVSPLEDTLCVVAMRANHQVGIADTVRDDRVASTPPVTSGRIGSYLGSPIRLTGTDSSEPMTVGVLCIYNSTVHDWTSAECDELEKTALVVAAELDRIRHAARGAA